MNRDALTLLGCSSSLAFVLLTGNGASADTIAPQSSAFVPPAPATQTVAVSPQIAQYAAIDPNSDTVGDLAIAKFKCDCPACRIAVVQLLQTGQLKL